MERFAFTDASVAQAEESLDDYSLFVNMDNRHLRRLLTTTDYQTAGIARIKSSYLVQVAFYTFLLNEGRAGNAGIDDGLLEGYQQRELDRVAQPSLPPSPQSNASLRQHHLRASSYSAQRRAAALAFLAAAAWTRSVGKLRPDAADRADLYLPRTSTGNISPMQFEKRMNAAV